MISVDGVDCRVNEPRRLPSTEWFSHKSNGPGLSYELGISIYESRLVWMRGPERAGKLGDLKTFQAPNGLKSKIPAGKKVIGVKAYKYPVCSIRNPLDSREVKDFKSRARARHESFNGRIKKFRVLAVAFRHRLSTVGILPLPLATAR
jgi:hypothetical protein